MDQDRNVGGDNDTENNVMNSASPSSGAPEDEEIRESTETTAEAPVEEPTVEPVEEQTAAPTAAPTATPSGSYPMFDETPKPEKKRSNTGLIVALCVVSGVLVLTLLFGAVCAGFLFVRQSGLSKKTEERQATESVSPRPSTPDVSTEPSQEPVFPTPETLPSSYETSEWVNTENADDENPIVRVAANCSPSVVTVKVDLTSGSASGSGVIWTENGYIVTNNHVVENSTAVWVMLSNNVVYPATCIATDPVNDLALLRVNVSGLLPAKLGDSDKLAVGQTAVAIGNPLGTLANTVTSGIVSALARDITVEGNEMNLMQISAAVNPGNSGGGCFNDRGELIGIVNAKQFASGIEGLAFAIPINTVKGVVSEMIKNDNTVLRKSIGITSCYVIDEENYTSFYNDFQYVRRVQEANSNKPIYGIYVLNDGQAIYAEGRDSFLDGDIIFSAEGKSVLTIEDVNKLLESKNEGDSVTFTAYRLVTSGGYWSTKYSLTTVEITVKVVKMYR